MPCRFSGSTLSWTDHLHRGRVRVVMSYLNLGRNIVGLPLGRLWSVIDRLFDPCSLGVEPVDQDVMSRPPRKATDRMITLPFLAQICASAFTIVAGTLWVFKTEVSERVGAPPTANSLPFALSSDTGPGCHRTRCHHDLHLLCAV